MQQPDQQTPPEEGDATASDGSTGRNTPGYHQFARELYATNIISDPWLEGQERFRLDPVVLSREVYARLCAAGEAVARVYDELARIVWERPDLLDDYFALTPYQKLMWLASEARWHGIARLDLFLLPDGRVQACEMNSDTPSGEAETVIVNAMRHAHHPELHDPNSGMEERFVRMVMRMHGRGRNDLRGLTVGIVYPTDLPEDLSMIALYRAWFEKRGCSVVLGSPFNIHSAPDGRAMLFDTPLDIAIRHYKTDWWGERVPAWSDEEDYEDPDPIDAPLRAMLDADARGATTVVNPFGAVLTQNKLTMSFLWDRMDLFSEESRRAITGYIPETRRLRDLEHGKIAREDWVLKSDYGCEGSEVVIGRLTDDAIWQESLEAATPERWVVQRFFEAAVDDAGDIANYGLYVIAGEAAEIYTRLSPTATDYSTASAPTFIRKTG
ncbi:MAG TPA: glutathionylspermidine synthase family protein [Candidatus Kapabacteria bacterium]|nr:glutathionylspermidine synthase family protein [Candidatus Kapabacteria bacterium]